MLFMFGRDVNIHWKHGINALADDQKTGLGRISIVLWGLLKSVIEEDGSPPILTDNTRGMGHNMHAGRAEGNKGEQLCRDFAKGDCRYGDACRFSHSR